MKLKSSSSNKAIESAPVGRPTRKGEAPLLAAIAGVRLPQMISRIPALKLLRQLYGSYADQNSDVSLRIWPCGYGGVIDLTSRGKTILCGVAGAYGEGIECFVQVGLPSVTRTIGSKISDQELRLIGEEPPMEVRFAREPRGIEVTILLNGSENIKHVLYAV